MEKDLAACERHLVEGEENFIEKSVWNSASDAIAGELSWRPYVVGAYPVGGGCIHQSFHLQFKDGNELFLKLNDESFLFGFEAEAAGLEELAGIEGGSVRVPKVLAFGAVEGGAYLALEYLDIVRRGDEREMGKKVARMHRHLAGDGLYGWDRDNTIGATPQSNEKQKCWVDFFREQRLRFQLQRAEENGLVCPGAEKLLDGIGKFFEKHHPEASLLHGDLWGENSGFLKTGEPVLYDPACYYGDRETDLAFTEMFGGFGASFYAGYAEVWALDPGYASRRDLYNLYHVLNHYNLFRGSYGGQAQRMVQDLVTGKGFSS